MIPKIIHQIWIGTRKLSEEHAGFMQQWKEMHSDYNYILWNDGMVNSENLITDVIRPYFQDTDWKWPVALKADILRYEIVRRFGGIYIDVDCEPINKLDPMLNCRFFSGIQGNGQVAIGIFGADVNNPLITDVCDKVVSNIHSFIERETIWNLEGAVDRASGPEFFTRVCEPYRNNTDYRFMDPKYFYPYWNKEDRPLDCKTAFPEAYSAHHWAKNWV